MPAGHRHRITARPLPPDVLEKLRKACRVTSQKAVAERIQVCPMTMTNALRGLKVSERLYPRFKDWLELWEQMYREQVENEARAMILRLVSQRPTCDACPVVTYDDAKRFYLVHVMIEREANAAVTFEEVRRHMNSRGWYDATHKPGFFKRCKDCEESLMFPWAERLLVEDVTDFMLTDPRCEAAFSVDILKETLKDEWPSRSQSGS